MESNIPYTILRPGSFRNDDRHGKLKQGLTNTEDGCLNPGLKVKKPIIGLEDLSDVCIDCLDSSDENDGKILYPRLIAFELRMTRDVLV